MLLAIIHLLAHMHYCFSEETPPKPNIIIIYTDEHNLRTLGCYRDLLRESQAFIWGPDIKVDTPNIDSIAKDGVIFTNFYTASPRSTTSQGTFLSGTYPKVNGARQNNKSMNGDVVTFPQVLQDELGYYTGYIGKVRVGP